MTNWLSGQMIAGTELHRFPDERTIANALIDNRQVPVSTLVRMRTRSLRGDISIDRALAANSRPWK
jgi:hypothetical protein